MEAIVCHKCRVTVRRDPDGRTTVGCGCDPDAPTWVAIMGNGRVLKMSHGSFEEVAGE